MADVAEVEAVQEEEEPQAYGHSSYRGWHSNDNINTGNTRNDNETQDSRQKLFVSIAFGKFDAGIRDSRGQTERKIRR